MNENKKFLEDLRNSKSFNESLDVIYNFNKRDKGLDKSEIIEMINIIVENGQVFGVLRPWTDINFKKNGMVREFISKYVDILSEDKESLDEHTINNLNKVFNAIYLLLLKDDIEKEIEKRKEKGKEKVYLYHANSVITSLGFILNKKLFSRKYGEDNFIPQTRQRSDSKDKKQGIYNDIFFDNSDIGEDKICAYGPITFVFSAKEIFDSSKEVKVTNENPYNVKNYENMYFSGLLEIKKEMNEGEYRFYKQIQYHTTIKNCDYIELKKENLKYIIIENYKNHEEVVQLNKECRVHSSIKLDEIFKKALRNANLNEVEVKIREHNVNKHVPTMATELEELWSSDLEVLYKRLYTKSGAWKNSSPGFLFLYAKRQISNIIKV